MIAPETNTLARRLVACENHMRFAVRNLNTFIREDDKTFAKDASKEITLALKMATHLPEDLIFWTACDDVQEKAKQRGGVDHIDMMCHMEAFNCGVVELVGASLVDINDATAAAVALKAVTGAQTRICDSHVTLKKWCEDRCIEKPNFPTTRDGGR